MNDPSTSPTAPPTNLRERARTRLQASSPSLQMAKDPSSALRVLFDLASKPATAHEALALLHELQVHQVELELQREELQSSRSELESAWDRQLNLNAAAPHAQLLLDGDACVLECNTKALTFLSPMGAPFLGKSLTYWIVSEDSARVVAWLQLAMQKLDVPSLCFTIRSKGMADRSVCAAARSNPTAPGLVLSWIEAPAHVVASCAA